jgi:K+:H+ antiporter
VGTLALALFTGTALAITAFPVLARVLAEHNLTRHPMGALSMIVAAANDVVGWCLLTGVVAIVTAAGTADVIQTVVGLFAYGVAMILVVRPALRWVINWMRGRPNAGPVLFVVIVVGLLVSSCATALVGLHPVFGAFLFGALLPRAAIREAAPRIPERVGQLNVLLLPVFFVTTGLSANVHELGWAGVAEVAAVVVVACLGKFAGAGAAAIGGRFTVRQTLTLGALLNTRGLTELIVLSIGLQVGVLDQRLFTVMVLMAVLTTVLAGPLLRLLKVTREHSQLDVDRVGPEPSSAVSR